MENDDDAAPTINDISDEVLRRILRFNSNDPQSYLSCERTCKAFQRVLGQDETWRFCPGAAHGLGTSSHRERALIKNVLARVHEYQQSHCRMNAFVDVLGVKGSRKMLKKLCQSAFKDHGLKLEFRGDTLAILLDMIQSNFITKLEQANRIAIHAVRRHEVNGYPVISADDLKVSHAISCIGHKKKVSTKERLKMVHQKRLYDLPVPDPTDSEIISNSAQTSIVRKIAYMAGVVKLTCDAFDFVWKNMLQTMLSIIYPAILELEKRRPHRLEPFPAGMKIDFERDIPPSRLFEGRPVEVVVPRLLRKHAKKQGLLNVYGSGWLVEEGKTLEQEKIEAEARYRGKPASASGDEHDYSTDDNCYFDESCSSYNSFLVWIQMVPEILWRRCPEEFEYYGDDVPRNSLDCTVANK